MLKHFATTLLFAALLGACGGGTSSNTPTHQTCGPAGSIPVGHWGGQWWSHALARPEGEYTGSVTLVVSESGRVSGTTVDNTSSADGSVDGALKQGGEFDAEYSVMYSAGKQTYALNGVFVCEKGRLTGRASIKRSDGDPGTMQFTLDRSP